MFYLTTDLTHFIYGYMVKNHLNSERRNLPLRLRGQAFSQDILKLLTFLVYTAFFGVKFYFICKISQNGADLRYLLDIKMLTQQIKGPSGILL